MNRAGLISGVVLVLLGTVFLIGGCAGKSPKVGYYSLVPMAAELDEARGEPLSIEVGPVSLPEALSREQIVTRSGANRIIINPYHRWAGSLDRDLTSVLMQNLAISLKTGRVSGFGKTPMGQADYRVILDVQQFDGTPGESVTLKATWTILNQKQKKVVAVRQSNLKETLAGPGFEELVHGQSHLVEKLSLEIVRELIQLSRGG